LYAAQKACGVLRGKRLWYVCVRSRFSTAFDILGVSGRCNPFRSIAGARAETHPSAMPGQNSGVGTLPVSAAVFHEAQVKA